MRLTPNRIINVAVVNLGGNWSYGSLLARVSFRSMGTPDTRDYDLSFRLYLEVR